MFDTDTFQDICPQTDRYVELNLVCNLHIWKVNFTMNFELTNLHNCHKQVTEAEKEKTKTEKCHLTKAAIFADMESRLPGLEKKLKKSIEKAR